MYPKDSSLACDQGFALSRESFGSIQSVQFFNGAKPCESLFLAWPRPRCLGFPRPFGFCGSRPRRLWRFQLRWLRWLLPRWLRLRGLEWLQPRWLRLLKSWMRVACKAGHAISRAFPFSSPLISWLLRCSVHEKESQRSGAARTGPETSILIGKIKCFP